MAALTLEQLRERSRAKFPVTVVKNEDYTTMTPTEIAAEWSAYSGGTDGVYLQNVAGTWAKMDPDLPKANNRGLLVFGGGKQYAQRCDFDDVTEGQAFPGNNYVPYWNYPNGLTLICADKDTEDGLPYVTVQFSGTPEHGWCGWNQAPGYIVVPHAEANTGDVVAYRQTIEILSLPVQVIGAFLMLYQHESVAGEQSVSYGITSGSVTKEMTKTDAGEAIDYWGFGIRLHHEANVAFASAAQIKMFPALISVNTAFPDHFHCLNTSTSAAATIVPEVMQRPWEYEGPWSVEIEVETPPRNLAAVTGSPQFYCLGDGTNRIVVNWAADNYVKLSITTDGGAASVVPGPEVTPGETVKFVVYRTAQTARFFVDGTEYTAITAPRRDYTTETLGHRFNAVYPSYGTFKSLVYRTGLATDAQLEEWSTAA